MNKTLQHTLAALSLTALVAAVTLPANAQDMTTMNKPMVQSDMSGKTTLMVPAKMSGADAYKAQWAYRNLDAREVKRFKSEGLTDATIMGAGNIALRAGLPLDYVVRLIKESGYPLSYVASMYGVPTNVVAADIPGYGAEHISMMSSSMSMGGGMSGGMGGSSMSGNMGMGMKPGMMSGTIVDIAMGNPDFSTLVTLIKAADLVDTLKGAGPFTVFAPTNAAFAKLPAGTLEDLQKPENKAKLQSILTYHVVPGKIMAADVMSMSNPSSPKSVQGATLNVKTTAPVMVNDANVTATDISASNGVIHVIDTVLMPPSP